MTTSARTPLAQKKRALLGLRIVGPVLLIAAVVVFWRDPAAVSAVAVAVILLTVTALYLVEVRYARALERALAEAVGTR